MKKHIILLALSLSVFIFRAPAFAQSANNQENDALQYHNKYEFAKAIEIYRQLLEQCTDSLKRIELEKSIIQSENGQSLLEYVFEPTVVTTKQSARKDFFLNYPGLENGSWIPLPKELAIDSTAIASGEFPVVYFPNQAKQIYYSAPDNSGSWNIYYSRLQGDTLWTVPQILNENVTSAGNELFPILSADGKSLFFASNGHYGVGGYDLYVSEWSEELNDWGIPQNMGFPYSSPQDDLFFYNTPDGLFSLFASNRNCKADSLTLYVVEFENVPLKREVSSQEALNISRLSPSGREKADSDNVVVIKEPNGENEQSRYTTAANKVRDLQNRLSKALKLLDENRVLYNTLTNQDDLAALAKKISEQEIETLSIQNETNTAIAELQNLEMEFLSKGMFIPQIDEDGQGTEQEGESANMSRFAFANMNMSQMPDSIKVEQPEPEVDLSFKISNEDAVIVDLASFPNGLVYQIQLFALSKQATIKSLRGLTPVFERKSSSGKYVYFAGIFSKYSDVLSNLNKVRKRGFPSALIAAFKDGKEILVRNARVIEQQLAESAAYRVIIEGYDTLPQDVMAVIRATTEKDIARAAEGGSIKYIVGPFGNEEQARLLVTALKAVSDKNIEYEQVK